MKIDEQQYLNAKAIVERYENEKARLDRIKGHSICPFCSGTKTKPFVRAFSNQNCTSCDINGNISNRKLSEMGLDDFMQKELSVD